ncbi:MAG TPA: hypothetical protein VFW25_06645 [Silvibacterium sp.]|nr:hypothetical protein [Silvibacterium sp.]
MKPPLRPFAAFTLIFLCLAGCLAARASNSEENQINSSGAAPADSAVIPGPLRPFLRMAGISPEISPAEVLPELSRNVYMLGYQEGGQTEYLRLLNRYVQFAWEIEQLAGESETIRVANCDDAIPLIRVLGYRFEGTCGAKDGYLVAARTERAFLTIDSGFPLTALEDSLRRHETFSYAFPLSKVPVLFHETDWVGASLWRKEGATKLLDVLLHDQATDRLYWAFSKSDDETRAALKQSPGLRELLPLAAALDFYGSELCIHSGRVLVPGGPGTEREWGDLVGASPGSPGNFVKRLLSKDRGWLAAYYDALSRVSRAQQAQLTNRSRFKRMYEVYRRAGGDWSATLGMFPRNGGLLLLFTRLEWQPNGEPYVPGTMAIWRGILTEKSSPKLVRGWVKHANAWNDPDQLLLSIAACSGIESDSGPLQLYLILSAIDHARAGSPRLSDATVRLLAENFEQFHQWYLNFSEFPELSDASITQFVETARAVNGIESAGLRANAMGAFQADVGMWQILARQQEIPAEKINESWERTVAPFAAVSSSLQLFEASRSSLRSMLMSAGGDGNVSEDEVIDLLAGPAQRSSDGRRAHAELVAKMRAVLDDQRLVSLDTLYGLFDGLDEMAHGSAMRDQLVQLAGDLREFELPRPILTSGEKLQWTAGIYTSRHAELQVRTDITKVIEHPVSNAQLEAARGQLTPFLRDTLVGLNYAYYEPPGAETLHHNPLLVRSHDFSGTSIQDYTGVWGSPSLIGVGVTAGGGAYLIGSLTDLPYALASTEEDFIAPVKVQALIWKSEAPELLVDAVEPRWWQVSPAELHAAALYQRFGEELLATSAKDANLRDRVMALLADEMGPKRLEETERAVQQGDDAAERNSLVTPSEEFYLASEFRKEFPAEAASLGAAGGELDKVTRDDPAETSPERVSRDFGVPHPMLAQTNGCEILNLKPFPAFVGVGYRYLGETWQSSNLYWARLADEMGYSPAMLNLLAPELTQRMVAHIFATDVEDWPALLRAMEQTGEEFRARRSTIASAATHQ